ncbi:MAG: hypothetical protein HOP07_06115 [Bacteriovoracaceae bacterium]|nr:hypothetical protein [Bacteriovoracaceae bacterium]
MNIFRKKLCNYNNAQRLSTVQDFTDFGSEIIEQDSLTNETIFSGLELFS